MKICTDKVVFIRQCAICDFIEFYSRGLFFLFVFLNGANVIIQMSEMPQSNTLSLLSVPGMLYFFHLWEGNICMYDVAN